MRFRCWAHWPWTEVTLWESEQCVTQKKNKQPCTELSSKENSLLLCENSGDWAQRWPVFEAISECINTYAFTHHTCTHAHFFPSSRNLFAYTTRKQFPLCTTPTCAFYYLLKMQGPGLKSFCWLNM